MLRLRSMLRERFKFRLGIRGKLTFGFIILATVSVIYAFLESHEIALLAQNINTLLDDSYLSDMNRIGEFMKNNKRDEFSYEHSLLSRAKENFETNYELAEQNVRHPHEKEALDTLYQVYTVYFRALSERIEIYEKHQSPIGSVVEDIHPELLQHLTRVRELNEKGLYQALAFLKDAPYRALRPGVIVIIVGLLFMLMFSYLVNHFFVVPIKQIAESIRRYLKFKTYHSVSLSADDEILELRKLIDRLIQEKNREQ